MVAKMEMTMTDEEIELFRQLLIEERLSAVKINKEMAHCTLRESMDYVAGLIKKLSLPEEEV